MQKDQEYLRQSGNKTEGMTPMRKEKNNVRGYMCLPLCDSHCLLTGFFFLLFFLRTSATFFNRSVLLFFLLFLQLASFLFFFSLIYLSLLNLSLASLLHLIIFLFVAQLPSNLQTKLCFLPDLSFPFAKYPYILPFVLQILFFYNKHTLPSSFYCNINNHGTQKDSNQDHHGRA